VRNPESPAAVALKDAGSVLAKADWEDKASLVEALRGVDAVFFMTSMIELTPKGCAFEVRTGLIGVEALKEAAVPFVIYSNVANLDKNTGIGHFESKWVVEKALKETGIPFFSVSALEM